MGSKFLIYGILILAVIGIIFISGCVEKECETDVDCLTKTCFTSQCTDNNCIYSPISDCCGNDKCEPGEIYENCVADCPNCDDKNDCTIDEYDYHEEKCINTPILDVVCCGNGVCDTGETYSNCARDCPNCDDKNKCTADSYDHHNKVCINEPIVPCCGNKICEETETVASCSEDCVLEEGGYVWIAMGYIIDEEGVLQDGYGIENCLSDNVSIVEVKGYFNGKEERVITKAELKQQNKEKISPVCGNVDNLVGFDESSVRLQRGEKYTGRIEFRFEYKGKLLEFIGETEGIVMTSEEGENIAIVRKKAPNWYIRKGDVKIIG